MKISLNWLRDYVALEAPVAEITRAITFLGFEVDQVTATGAPPLDKVVVGEVLTREKHPNADKLTVCSVDVGPAGGVKTIVCGAQNHKVGDRVPVALPGAVLPGNFKIGQSKNPRPAFRRDDVLGTRDRRRRRRRRTADPAGPAGTGRPDQLGPSAGRHRL